MLWLLACTHDPPLQVAYRVLCRCACTPTICADLTYDECSDEGDTEHLERIAPGLCEDFAARNHYSDCKLIPLGDLGELVGRAPGVHCAQYEPAPMN